MTLVDWLPIYSVGVEFMDADHQQLMQLINELHVDIGRGDPEAARASLDRLIDATRAHFAAEEQIMQSSDYRWFFEHQRAHDELVAELEIFRAKFATVDAPLGPQLTEFLRDWLLDHILVSDKHLGGFIEGVGARTGEA